MPAEHKTPDDPTIKLARVLYEEMVRLDPGVTPDEADPDWPDLCAYRREFYRLCVARLLVEPELARLAAAQLAGSPTTT